MKVATIVQARMESTRLPGKVLQKIAGQTVLAWVLQRCEQIARSDVVCCAVANSIASDEVAEEARRANVVVVRGPGDDVLARYALANDELGADIVLRVTSDCPLIDPSVCDQVIELLIKDNADYAANNMPPSFPHGLDCEAFTGRALRLAAQTATSQQDREHVTPWIRRNPELVRSNLTAPGGEWVEQRWTLDYSEDLDFLTALFARRPGTDWTQTAALVAQDKTLASINESRRVSRASV
ncbi:MAG: cytidylyltransferase domain-containing protein [Hyphomicrobiaceae bacterium]